MSEDMFKGKDYPTQWALNPSTCQNMSNDQVDWAALAQQWIKMKETVMSSASLPSNTNSICSGNNVTREVPVDTDIPKKEDTPLISSMPTISGTIDTWNQWNQWDHWNTSGPSGGAWEWSSGPPPNLPVTPEGKSVGVDSVPVISTSSAVCATTEYNVPPAAAQSLYSYNSVPSAQSYNQVGNYWSLDSANVLSSQQCPFVKEARHPHKILHMRTADVERCPDDREKAREEDTITTIDAAKRRQLPAWIREGLEKMEKEKQKAIERERQEILRKQELEARKHVEDEVRAVLNPSKSKFDSDSEKEGEQEYSNDNHQQSVSEKSLERTSDVLLRPRKSRFRDAHSPDSRAHIGAAAQPSSLNSPSRIHKRSGEEIMQEAMIKVRRSLTEILLEVTNEEISLVCKEVWSRARTKVHAGETPVAQLSKATPVAQVTRNLGLGIYGDSNSESEDDQTDLTQVQNNDSDVELIESMQRRQQAFKKTEEEIEARLAEEDKHEKRLYDEQHVKQVGNTGNRTTVNQKEASNSQRTVLENVPSLGRSPQPENTLSNLGKISSPSDSVDSETNSSDSTSTDSSYNCTKKKEAGKIHTREHRKRKSESKSEERDSRSSSFGRTHKDKSRSRSTKSRKGDRSRSSSNYSLSKKHRSRSRIRKRERSHSKSCHRSRSTSSSTKWAHSHSRRKRKSRSHSRSRKRSRSRSTRRSKSRGKDKRKSRSRGREKSQSRTLNSKGSRSYVSKSRRMSRSRSRSRRKSRSKSWQSNHWDSKKSSSHRYRD